MRIALVALGTLSLVTASCAGHRPSATPAVHTPERTASPASFAALGSKRVTAVAQTYPRRTSKVAAQPPMSLTGSDGTGLELVALEGRAVVQGPLAFTELHLSFRNPENRIREGRFSITLPPSAAISRFAMKLPTGWQEAEVVERHAARRIYEDFLHRRQDPALLEKKAGNQFRARVFPIPARGIKEIKVSYSERLVASDQPYRLYLQGLPQMERLQLSALVSQREVEGQSTSSLGGVAVSQRLVKLARENHVPREDFVVPTDSTIGGLQHDNLALMRIRPILSTDRAEMSSLLVMVDTSASRAAGFRAQVEQLGALLARLEQTYGPGIPLHIACFDQEVESVFSGKLGQFAAEHRDRILARRPLGASDLERALSWIGRTRGFQRVLLLTDGIATAGATEGAALRRAVENLAGTQSQRLDVLLVGGIRDEAGMRKLVTGALESDGVLLDSDAPVEQLADRLSRRTLSGIRVQMPSARWTWPRRLDGIQPGDDVLIFAELKDATLPARELTVRLSGPLSQTHQATLTPVARPLLQRAWVEARIAHLEHRRDTADLGPDIDKALQKQIVELSVKNRVLSDYTALLVLETEADYARYGIKRTALADILVVGPSGVEVMQRGRRVPPPAMVARPEPPRPAADVASTRTDTEQRERPPIATAQGAPGAPPAPPTPAPRSGPVAKSSPSRPRPRPVRPTAKRAKREGAPSIARSARTLEMDDERDAAPAEDVAPAAAEPQDARRLTIERLRRRRPAQVASTKKKGPPALTGKLAEVMALIEAGKIEQALIAALQWRTDQPGDVMALVALGEALQASGNQRLAARVYGSIIDLFPSRADMRRFAGERLEALEKVGLELATDTYRQAVKQRPDHQSAHRLLAFALLRLGEYEQAFAALEAGLEQPYRIARRGFRRIMLEDLGLVGAAWVAREPKKQAELSKRLDTLGAKIAEKPSLRFVINWETDANDVDFHIHDGQGGHAYYRSRQLPSGGVLYADVTNGFGPECFTIDGDTRTYPYRLEAHYYSRGPMGYGMGKLQVIEHDGKGGLSFVDRPFVVMNDRAYVDLGAIKGPLL
jgi:tetratricopeptide (TPR) repeat protein